MCFHHITEQFLLRVVLSGRSNLPKAQARHCCQTAFFSILHPPSALLHLSEGLNGRIVVHLSWIVEDLKQTMTVQYWRECTSKSERRWFSGLEQSLRANQRRWLGNNGFRWTMSTSTRRPGTKPKGRVWIWASQGGRKMNTLTAERYCMTWLPQSHQRIPQYWHNIG